VDRRRLTPAGRSDAAGRGRTSVDGGDPGKTADRTLPGLRDPVSDESDLFEISISAYQKILGIRQTIH